MSTGGNHQICASRSQEWNWSTGNSSFYFLRLIQLNIFCFKFENKAAVFSFNFIPAAIFYSLAVKSSDFLKLSYMEKVKVGEQEKEGENDN